MSEHPGKRSGTGSERRRRGRGGAATAAGANDPAGADERQELLRLTSVAAHQLKAPLSSVLTAVQTLAGGFVGPVSDRQRHLLELAAEKCTRGLTLVSDVVRLRKLDRLTADALHPHDIGAAFAAAMARVRAAAAAKDLILREHMAAAISDGVWVRSEPGLIEEIMAVLLENAVKYTPPGGEVIARVSLAPGEAGEQVVFECSDSGIGIPPEALDHVFEEFFRAANAVATSAEGTGLGLAFAARAVRALGGGIEVEPGEQGGTRAVVTLPRCAAPTPEGPRPEDASHPERGAAPGTVASPRPPSQRVVVVGGVAAGAKAAATVIRWDPDAEVTVIERGRLLSYAGCGLPYYIAGTVRDQRTLLSTPLGVVRDSTFFHQVKRIRALEQTEALEIDRATRVVHARSLVTGERLALPYDRLVLATGSTPRVPAIPGTGLEGVFTLHGVDDAEGIRAGLRSLAGRELVIVGAGLIGCEITESVALRGCRVTLIEQGDSILRIVDPELAVHVQRHMEARGVRILLGCRATEIEGEGRVRAVRLADGRTLPCDMVILAAGIAPCVDLAARAGIELGPTGAIAVDGALRTSDPAIFAAGDCAQSTLLVTGEPAWVPMGSTAIKHGRVAGINVAGGSETFPGVVGTMILKAFDLTIARTGLSEREARERGIEPVCALVPGVDRAHYLPTSRRLLLKLVADRATGRLLGAQGIGEGEVAKRIDVIATALSAGLDIARIAYLDLAYAPPYSLAMDIVLAAVHVLRAKLTGRFTGITARELHESMISTMPPFILDVRLPAEFDDTRLPGSVHIPLGALRGRMHQVPAGREIVVTCALGVRSYEAALALHEHGYDTVRVLEGGLSLWPYEVERV
jgi:NADPH-dependent 2,4-dienoyl-CoA reductase/sulfur reductase-like enzyme/rhodanese-related sulfurtransferase